MEQIAGKLLENKPVSSEELFRLVDVHGSGTIDLETLQRYFKRTGINLTDHKMLEVLTEIKGDIFEPGE